MQGRPAELHASAVSYHIRLERTADYLALPPGIQGVQCLSTNVDRPFVRYPFFYQVGHHLSQG